MAKIDVKERISELALPLLASFGFELVDIEYRREGHDMVLRIFIDKPDGVVLDDCSAVSRELSEVLDVEDFIRDPYTMEISSPGLNRSLKNAEDYLRYTGQLVKVRTFEPLPDDTGSSRKTFFGKLLGLEDGVVRIKLREGRTAGIPLDKVAKANLEFEF